MGFLSSLFGIDDAKAAAQNAASQNRQVATDAYNKAYDIQNPLYTQGMQSYGLLNNFLGVNGQGAQQSAYDNYVQGPDVQSRMQQGIRALDNSYAGRNAGTVSGGQLKALTKYGTDVATQDLNSYLSRLAGVGQMGQTAANALTNANYNSAGITSNANTAEGNAVANAELAGGSILGNLIGAGIGLAGNAFGGGFNPFRSSQTGSSSLTKIASNDPWAGMR